MSPIILIFLSALLPAITSTDIGDSFEGQPRNKRLALHPSQWSMHLWPGGVVPYEIAPHYDDWERGVILSAMAEFPKHTCISFRPRNAGDKYYLSINKYYNLERCFSYIGRQTTNLFRTPEGNVETRMRLDPSCLKFNGRGTVMHELMHIIGFYHEHQRDDRDPRVAGSATHYNFKIYPRWSTYYMGNYDPTSIMHYNFPGIVYPRTYFSVSDVLRINTLYRCPKQTSAMSTAATPTTTRTTSRPTWSTQRVTNWSTRPTTTFVPKWSTARAFGTTTTTVTRPITTWTTSRTQSTTTTKAPVWTTRSWTSQRWAPPVTTAAPAWTTTRRLFYPWPTTTTTWAPSWPSRATTRNFSAARSYKWPTATTTTWIPIWPSRITNKPSWPATNKTDKPWISQQSQQSQDTTLRSTTRMPEEEDEQLSQNGILRRFRI